MYLLAPRDENDEPVEDWQRIMFVCFMVFMGVVFWFCRV